MLFCPTTALYTQKISAKHKITFFIRLFGTTDNFRTKLTTNTKLPMSLQLIKTAALPFLRSYQDQHMPQHLANVISAWCFGKRMLHFWQLQERCIVKTRYRETGRCSIRLLANPNPPRTRVWPLKLIIAFHRLSHHSPQVLSSTVFKTLLA